MKSDVINYIQKLNNNLKNVNLPITNKIVKYSHNFIKKKSLTNIKDYIFKLDNDRKQIKNLILKYERSIIEIDKKRIMNKQSNEVMKIRHENKDLLIKLNQINSNIKNTLYNIIILIK